MVKSLPAVYGLHMTYGASTALEVRGRLCNNLLSLTYLVGDAALHIIPVQMVRAALKDCLYSFYQARTDCLTLTTTQRRLDSPPYKLNPPTTALLCI